MRFVITKNTPSTELGVLREGVWSECLIRGSAGFLWCLPFEFLDALFEERAARVFLLVPFLVPRSPIGDVPEEGLPVVRESRCAVGMFGVVGEAAQTDLLITLDMVIEFAEQGFGGQGQGVSMAIREEKVLDAVVSLEIARDRPVRDGDALVGEERCGMATTERDGDRAAAGGHVLECFSTEPGGMHDAVVFDGFVLRDGVLSGDAPCGDLVADVVVTVDRGKVCEWSAVRFLLGALGDPEERDHAEHDADADRHPEREVRDDRFLREPGNGHGHRNDERGERSANDLDSAVRNGAIVGDELRDGLRGAVRIVRGVDLHGRSSSFGCVVKDAAGTITPDGGGGQWLDAGTDL